MEKQKVYIVFCHYWADSCGETIYDYTDIDSIWSNMEVAKKRVDDLANEYVRSNWYDQDCDLESFECKTEWNSDKMSVTLSNDPYAETTYYIEVHNVDPCIDDFEGP